MMSTALDLIKEIEKLPPAERVRMIDRVIRDTIKPDAESEKIWICEAVARWSAFERGEISTVPYEAVMDRYRDKR
jgi:putative addiction module component (TIGR02574 family)